MVSPYQDKVSLWHWEGDAVGEATIDDLARMVKTRAPVTDAIFVKTSDGPEWQAAYDSKAAMRITGPDAIARWVSTLRNYDLEFHAWCVLRGVEIEKETSLIVQTARVPGVKSVILDIEPYQYYWQGSREDVIRLMTGVRNALGSDFHIGLSVDPRRHWYDDIYPDAWRPYVDSVHPMCYWGTMRRTPEDILTETYVVWGKYGLPIYPVLQAHGVSPDSIRQAQDIARSVRGATGLSYWRIGVIGPMEYDAINKEKVESELGPDEVWRRYGWEKIVAPYQSGYFDGTHTGVPANDLMDEFTSVRGHPIKYKKTRADRDTVWTIWRPNIPAKGTYELSVFVPGRHASTHSARYHIHGVSGSGQEIVVKLDQSRYFDQWVPLVVYEFDNVPDGAQVNLTDLTGESNEEIAFTAIRWRRVLEMVEPEEKAGFDPPIGTVEERLGAQVWPGTWFDATGYATYYTSIGPAYHTGADLNNNSPRWDSDRGAPVYAPADGIVTFSAPASGTWAYLIIVRHDPLPDGMVVWSRYAHIQNALVREGDRVERGQQIASVGNANGKLPYHLHFDIAKTDILEERPGHWPGLNLDEVYRHYVDPRQFIRDHRPVR